MQLAKDNDCPFVDNETPYDRAKKVIQLLLTISNMKKLAVQITQEKEIKNKTPF